MSDEPRSNSKMPIVVQAGWEDWNEFAVDLICNRANDNAGWRRDIEGDQERVAEPVDPEMDKVLSGLLKPAPKEDLLQKIQREQQERMKRIAQGVEQPQQEQERGLDLDDDRRW